MDAVQPRSAGSFFFQQGRGAGNASNPKGEGQTLCWSGWGQDRREKPAQEDSSRGTTSRGQRHRQQNKMHRKTRMREQP